LARLLTSMKDEDGKVAIAGFYDGLTPLTAEEQAMLDAVPDEPARLLPLFGIAEPERRDLSLQNALQLPSLNVRGLSSAYVGAHARTIIPDRAIAALDIRLVKETPALIIAKKILAHIRPGVSRDRVGARRRDEGPPPANREGGDARCDERLPHVAPSTCVEARRGRGDEDVGRPARAVANERWHRAHRPVHRSHGVPGNRRADRELRQQLTCREREPPPWTFLFGDRDDHGPARDVTRRDWCGEEGARRRRGSRWLGYLTP
jgi:Peptidase dimerisation domain